MHHARNKKHSFCLDFLGSLNRDVLMLLVGITLMTSNADLDGYFPNDMFYTSRANLCIHVHSLRANSFS